MIMQSYPGCLERYYDLLEAVDEKIVLEYLKLRRLDDGEGRYFEYFCRFREQRFLYNYRSPEGVIQSLNRVYNIATGARLEEKYEGELYSMVPRMDKHLKDQWEGYFFWMKEKLGDAF